MPRKASCECGACPKCRARAKKREAYRAMTAEERRALVARRDPERVKANDRARYYRYRAKRLVVAREYDQRNPQQARARKQAWIQRNPEKRRAQNAVSNALRDGRLTKGGCALADEGGCRGRIEAHHEDYAKPLEVTWLCSEHHGRTRRQAASSPMG